MLPFTTAEGSGLGNTTDVLKNQFDQSKVLKGFTARGNTVKNNPSSVQKRVDKWLNDLGY